MKKTITLFIALFAMLGISNAQTCTVVSFNGTDLPEKQMEPLLTTTGYTATFDVQQGGNYAFGIEVIDGQSPAPVFYGYDDLDYLCSNATTDTYDDTGYVRLIVMQGQTSVTITFSDEKICVIVPESLPDSYHDMWLREAQNVTANSATLLADLIYADTPPNSVSNYSEVGFYYSTIAGIQGETTAMKVVGTEQQFEQQFGAFLDGLQPNTKYYYRAFATFAANGETYLSADELSFTTGEAQQGPSFVLNDATNVTDSSAVLGAIIDDYRVYDMIGFYLSETPGIEEASLGDYRFVDGYQAQQEFEIGGYVNYLKPNTTYYYKAATGNPGAFTFLSDEEKSFTTQKTQIELDIYASANAVTDVSAHLMSQISFTKGESTIQKVSFIYGSDIQFDDFTGGTTVEATLDGQGNYSAEVEDLLQSTIYNVAVKVELADTIITDIITEFETLTNPNIVLYDATNVSTFSATIEASVDDLSNYSNEERGFYYSRTPNIKDTGIYTESLWTGNSNIENGFYASLDTLTSNTTIYYVAYVKAWNDYIFISDEEKSFTTEKEPLSMWVESWENQVTDESAILTAQIGFDSPEEPIQSVQFVYSSERGFDYLTTGTTVDTQLDGQGNYVVKVEGLTPGTVYSTKVKVQLADTLVVAEGVMFETLVKPEIILHDATDITSGSAKISATVSNLSDYLNFDYGFYYSRIANIKDADVYSEDVLVTYDTTTFKSSLDTLPPNTTIYYVAFVQAGPDVIFMSEEEKSFTTLDAQINYNFELYDADSVAYNSAYLQSELYASTEFGVAITPQIIEFGFIYDTDRSFDPALTGQKVIAEIAPETFNTYAAKVEQLKEMNHYFYYAYAKLDGDTIVYSDKGSFQTPQLRVAFEAWADEVTSNSAKVYAQLIEGFDLEINKITIAYADTANFRAGNTIKVQTSYDEQMRSYFAVLSGLDPEEYYKSMVIAELSDTTVTQYLTDFVTDVLPPMYFVAGSAELCNGKSWVPNAIVNQLSPAISVTGAATNQIVYRNVPAGTYQFVVTDGTFDNTWGYMLASQQYCGTQGFASVDGSDYIQIHTDSISDITINFDGDMMLCVATTLDMFTYPSQEVIQVKVNLNANGGSVVPNFVMAVKDSLMVELPLPTQENMHFAGWHDAQGNLISANTIFTGNDGDILTAQWESVLQEETQSGETVEYDFTSTTTVIVIETQTNPANPTEVSVPETIEINGEDYPVTSLAETAFQDALVEVVFLPSTLIYVDGELFNALELLEYVTVNSLIPPMVDPGTRAAMMGKDLSQVTLYVPHGTKAAYERAPLWNRFGDIQEMLPTEVEVSTADLFSVTPNPASEFINITANEMSAVYIYNLAGELLITSSRSTINVASLINGLYLVKVETANGNVQTTKFVKK